MKTQIAFVQAWINARIEDERAASLVEYALLVALIAVVCIGAVTALGQGVDGQLDSATSGINSAG